MYNAIDYKNLMNYVNDEPTPEEIAEGLKKKKLPLKQLFEIPKDNGKKKIVNKKKKKK